MAFTPAMSAPCTLPSSLPAFWKVMVGCTDEERVSQQSKNQRTREQHRAHNAGDAGRLGGLCDAVIINVHLEESSLHDARLDLLAGAAGAHAGKKWASGTSLACSVLRVS